MISEPAVPRGAGDRDNQMRAPPAEVIKALLIPETPRGKTGQAPWVSFCGSK